MTCEKVTYETYKDAYDDLKGLRGRQKKHNFTAYKCPNCGKFHIKTIGKKTLRTPKKIDKYPIKYENVVREDKNRPRKKKKKKFYDSTRVKKNDKKDSRQF